MKRVQRGWMYERFDGNTKRLNVDFEAGVEEFINYAKGLPSFLENKGKIRCPCSKCNNNRFHNERDTYIHIRKNGFVGNYYDWVCHGEPFPGSTSNARGENPYHDMVNDALLDRIENVREEMLNLEENDPTPNPEILAFFEILKKAEEPLYEGSKVSVLEIASRLLTLKCEHNLSHKCVDGICNLIGELIPKDNLMTTNFYQVKKVVKALELPHERIDVCPEGCMLFWNENKDVDKCKKCDSERYKPRKNSKGKRVAQKTMFYFPLAPRLQRLYATQHIAGKMRWHAENPRPSGVMSHPSDAENWKHFDQMHPEFARETRNVRLGLCTDGFAPFGQFGKSYSCWPVMVTTYNLPPELCMKRQFIFTSLIIPGPKNPKAKFDIYLQPLVKELKMLWETGVFTHDVSTKRNFQMRAALMWTINDFPAYGMLSGWGTAGEHACPYCSEGNKSFWLDKSGKWTWFDCHRQFLQPNHPFRKDKGFLKKKPIENSTPPRRLSGDEIWERVKDLPTIVDATNAELKSLKNERIGWWKQSILWELEYWPTLHIRHNLDLMHCQKNFFERLIHTLLDEKTKTSYGPKSKADLEKLCRKRPEGIFVLDKAKRKALCDWLTKLKFPDGYASDLSRCIDREHYTLRGLKSHDCHVFMQRLLPVALRELLPVNVWNPITELSQFFRDLCAGTITIEDMTRLENNIPEILCKLEKILPPAFFNSMQHLAIHLPYECKVGGPVQYRWMFPFERFLGHLKLKIGNKAAVEGSICNGYLLEEISNFCSMYFGDHIDTKAKNLDVGSTSEAQVDSSLPELFQDHNGSTIGKCKERYLDEKEYKCAHKYVLSNCEIARPYEALFEEFIKLQHPHISDTDIWSKYGDQFPRWLLEQATNIDNDVLKALALGPSRRVRTWKRYSINGYKFRTFNSMTDIEKSSLNNGVSISSTEGGNYYGTLSEVIELEYPGSKALYKTTLFKCDWLDNSDRSMKVHKDYKLVEVYRNRKYPLYDPFVLAYQVDQVYYASFPSLKKDKEGWNAVFKMKGRSTIDAPVDESVFHVPSISDVPSLSSPLVNEEEENVGNEDDEGIDIIHDDVDDDVNDDVDDMDDFIVGNEDPIIEEEVEEEVEDDMPYDDSDDSEDMELLKYLDSDYNNSDSD